MSVDEMSWSLSEKVCARTPNKESRHFKIFSILIFAKLLDDDPFRGLDAASFLPTPGNTNVGCVTVPLTSCLTGLESAVWQLTIFDFIFRTDSSKPVKQEVNGTVILRP